MSYQIYNFTLGSNESETLITKGKFLKVLSASNNFKISINSGKKLNAITGRQIKEDLQGIQNLEVFNDSGSTNTIEIFVGNYEISDDNDSGILSSLNLISGNISELKELSFGNNGISVLTQGVTTKTFNFRGIQVLLDLDVVTISGSNAGTDLNAIRLPAGYHPVSGTAINVTGNTGLAYLIGE